MELPRHFRPQIVFDLPNALRQFVDEQRHFPVAQFLIDPPRPARVVLVVDAASGAESRRCSCRCRAPLDGHYLPSSPGSTLLVFVPNFRSTEPDFNS